MSVSETFLKDAQSTQWWVSVVLVGLLIHLAGSYLKPFIDKRVASIFKSARFTFTPNEELVRRKVEELRQSEVKQVKLMISEMRHKFLALFYFVITAITFYPMHDFLDHHGHEKIAYLVILPFLGVLVLVTLAFDNWTQGIDDRTLLNKLDNPD